VFSALLSARLVALPPVKLILCAVVGQSARINEAVNRVVHVVREHLWTPYNAW
jgi:hypothetical protein